jgi:hypothetical protein
VVKLHHECDGFLNEDPHQTALIISMRTERDYIMVPERFKDYFFNDWDYLPETYPMDDKERE